MKCVILAAGNGSRLEKINHYKPLIEIQGRSLLEHSVFRLQQLSPENITIVFNENARKIPQEKLPFMRVDNISCIYQNTDSSLHTLYEAVKSVSIAPGEHLLVTMIDTLVSADDFCSFTDFCKTKIKSSDSCLMVTPYIDDEKPLTVKIDDFSNIIEFQSPLEESKLVTSGIYYFSYSALNEVKLCIDKKIFRMRNFLKAILDSGAMIKSFEVEKTMDVDRPEDIVSANSFSLE